MVKTPAAEAFVGQLAAQFRNAPEGVMLTPAIQKAYVTGLAARETRGGIQAYAHGKGSGKPGRALPTLLAVGAKTFLSDRKLQAELFGPSSLIVWCDDLAQLGKVLETLEGNLTATIHGTDEEILAQAGLRAQLEALAGRVVVNGFPTGVEVSHAIVHGGPYPSLSDGRSTSVGSNAIYRFTRLVCYQNHPDAALPAELQNANPLGLSRLVNGVMRSGDKVG
jgi:NADP-dependent aldehyde dehydrogenase